MTSLQAFVTNIGDEDTEPLVSFPPGNGEPTWFDRAYVALGVLLLLLLGWAIAMTVLYAVNKNTGSTNDEDSVCECTHNLGTQRNPALFDAGPALGPSDWSDIDAYEAFACVINVSKRVLCVDGSATRRSTKGSGTCWTDPYATLDDALAHARAHPGKYCAIFVADGEYRPSTTYAPSGVVAGAFSLPENNPGTDTLGVLVNYSSAPEYFNGKLETFDLVDGVAIYGGFQGQSGPGGGEMSSLERIRGAFPTVLVGERASNHSTAVWHVLSAGDDIAVTGVHARLDGLTVRGGDCLLAPYFPVEFFVPEGLVPVYYHDDGAGLYVFVRSEVAVHDCRFEDNTAVVGAAIFAHDGSTVRTTASELTRQTSASGAFTGRSGGPSDQFTNGSTVASTTTLQFIRSKLTDPIVATLEGGFEYAPLALCSQTNIVPEPIGAQFDIIGSLFDHIEPNIQPQNDYWGIINVWAPNGRLRIISSSFTNVAGEYVSVTDPYLGGSLEMRRCYIANATSAFSAVLLETTNLPNYAIIEQTRFHNCTATDGNGGAVGALSIGSLQMRDCTFTNNTAAGAGGALFLDVPSSVHDNVFVFNDASAGPDVFVASGPLPAPDNIFCAGYDNGVAATSMLPISLPSKHPFHQ